LARSLSPTNQTGNIPMIDAKPQLLVVDDERDTCANLADIFSDLGYEVDVAYDGASALELVKEKTYDVALLDLKMPGMDGLELFQRIKEISHGTVAIVVTAYATSETARKILDAGAWRIMPKPVDFPALLHQVNEALDQPLVLVVDDDHDLCHTLWDLFRDRGLRVHIAHDVDAANERLRTQGFNVVLIDFKLPQGSGVDVLRSVQQQNPQARTILITGYRNEAELAVKQALDQGADAVCYKPFDVPELLELTSRLAQKDVQA
jgi:DNA-binding NtrC family response regulator